MRICSNNGMSGEKMKIIVQKFGGTSVSTLEKRKNVIEKIKNSIEKGYKPVVVVSAMGRIGEPYATDTLLSLISEETKKNNKQATDLLMSCGEVISTCVMCSELNSYNIKSVPLTGGQGGIITDNNSGDAEVKELRPNRIFKYLEEGYVPVIAGFQGVSNEGIITTLGRGGSDTSAALIGKALKAEKIEIYTDVDGIMTADPRIVGNASLIEEISYAEVFQFADQGAKVIHPRAVEIAMESGIPLIIKNTVTDCEGTIINSLGCSKNKKLITGITHMKDRVQVTIKGDDNKGNDKYENILDIMAENYISIDLINVFTTEVIFTIGTEDLDKFINIMEKSQIKYIMIKKCSKIAIIGNKIRGVPGVMARIIRALKNENIQVLQTSDSHTTIWCLVRESETVKAINTLHKEFQMYK